VSWYWWVALWAVLVILSACGLGLIGLSLWRKAKALAGEISTAANRLTAVSDGLQELAERTADPAVFTAPSQLRQERFLSARQRGSRRASGGADLGRGSTRGSGQSVR
jgi:hypothetical protein